MSDLSAFLAGANLSQHEAQLTALGSQVVADLADVEDAELEQLGLKGLEIKRLRRKIEEHALGGGELVVPDYDGAAAAAGATFDMEAKAEPVMASAPQAMAMMPQQQDPNQQYQQQPPPQQSQQPMQYQPQYQQQQPQQQMMTATTVMSGGGAGPTRDLKNLKIQVPTDDELFMLCACCCNKYSICKYSTQATHQLWRDEEICFDRLPVTTDHKFPECLGVTVKNECLCCKNAHQGVSPH